MGKKKKIEKSIESFKKQIKEHTEKIENYEGENYALRKYWEEEIEERKKDIERYNSKLKKVNNLILI